jgi:hypothetical protein
VIDRNVKMPRIHDTPPPAPSISPSAMEEERRQNIRVKNRRKLYLDRHPSYFTAPDLELAGTLVSSSHILPTLFVIVKTLK